MVLSQAEGRQFWFHASINRWMAVTKLRWMQVEADDVGHLLGQLGIVAGFDVARAMRLQLVLPPEAGMVVGLTPTSAAT